MQEFLKSLNVLTAGVRLSGDFGRRTARWTGVLALMLSLTNTSRGQPVESPADALRAATLLEKAFEQVIEKSSRAIVSLQIEEVRGDGKSPPAGRSPQTQTDLFGSGVLLRGEGDQRFILTNAHLVQSVLIPATGSRMTATWGEHRRVPVAVHAADPRSDLAILRIDLGGRLKPAAIPALTIGRAEGLRRGRLVVTLGNPYAIAWDGNCSASFGMISNLLRRPFLGDGRRKVDDGNRLHQLGLLMQLDTRLQLGSSGGAVLTLDGEWVGLTTPLAVLPGTEKTAGFAIPFQPGIRRVIDSLLKGYEVEYGFLGIAPQDIPLPELGPVPEKIEQSAAPYVTHVAQGGPADLAGIKTGDVILSAGTTTVLTGDDLVREVGLLGPDAEVTLQVWRPRTGMLECTAKLGKWPVYDDQQLTISAERYPLWRGVRVDYPTSRRRYLPTDPLERYPQAVVVTSAAESSGLIPGDYVSHVDQLPVRTPSEFQKAIERRAGPVTLTKVGGGVVIVAP